VPPYGSGIAIVTAAHRRADDQGDYLALIEIGYSAAWADGAPLAAMITVATTARMDFPIMSFLPNVLCPK
jgi:hypothetical protein